MQEPLPRTLVQLAELVAGTPVGNLEEIITGAAPLGEVAQGQITFIDQPERSAQAAGSAAAAVLVPVGVGCEGKPTIEVANVHAAFAAITSYYRPRRQSIATGVAPSAVVSPSAKLAADVTIGPGATVGEDVVIGQGSVVHAGAHLMAPAQGTKAIAQVLADLS